MSARPALRIVWDEASRSQWSGLFSRISNSCYMHTWAYGESVRDMTRMNPRRGIIYRNGVPVGLVQAFQSLYFFKTCSVTKVLRGPLWFASNITQEEQLHTFALMQAYYSKGFRNAYQILPELEDTPENRKLMQVLGLRRALPGYSTSFLDIRPNLEDIRQNFKDSWRNSLNYAEKLGIETEYCQEYRAVEWLLDQYDESLHKKGFSGPSADFIRSYLRHSTEPYVLIKTVNDTAALLLITHGLSATYLIGWNSLEAKQLKTNHLLLWEAIQKLRNMGVESIDLGGIDTRGTEGISKFKEGTGGKPFNPVGMYVRV